MYYLYWPWPVLRTLARELGQRLTDAGTLRAPEDLYYLHSEEIETAIAARAEGRSLPEYQQQISERRELR